MPGISGGKEKQLVVDLSEVSLKDIQQVGGKNASTGEMIRNLSGNGILVPGGFATTAEAYRIFLKQNGLDKKIIRALSATESGNSRKLDRMSAEIRNWIESTPFFPALLQEIKNKLKNIHGPVAVRSSATAEDLPDASFAGQQETFLNVSGTENILHAIRRVYASLFTSRAIAYREHHGFGTEYFALSAGIQPMIRSDRGTSGVMFTLDTESGFDKVILINAAYGLGESIVQGQVNPDEFHVYKPAVENKRFAILQKTCGDKSVKMVYAAAKSKNTIRKVSVSKKQRHVFCLSDSEIMALAQKALIIEKHYGKPMDIEWAKDGINGKLYILQARPETVKSRESLRVLERYHISGKGKKIVSGLSTGQKIGSGKTKIILHAADMHKLKPGEVLVTDMTDPDWEPVMKIAAAIVTNRGGRTCHAAIIAREAGIPAVVGCINATRKIRPNTTVTVSCAEGETGYVYEGKIPFHAEKIQIDKMPEIPLRLCLNLGNPEKAYAARFLPNSGVGLARLEFIISRIGIHPGAAIDYPKLPRKIQREMLEKIRPHTDPVEYYVEKLREGIAKIAAAFYPKQVIFRFSDFKSNEYGNLFGGRFFEEYEENPMLGFRGASRYYHSRFSRCFALECRAFKQVRDEMGLTNANIMIPFVRTVDELKKVIALAAESGLARTKNGLKIYMMCEIPANVVLAEQFLEHVDGFSIGSNDLTQLVLGLDRDSGVIAPLFDERNEAVKFFLEKAISACKKQNKYIGICGQGPSDHPDFAKWLMAQGIDSISLDPDSIVATWFRLSENMPQL